MNVQDLKQTNVTGTPSAPTLKDRMSVAVKGDMLVTVKTAQVNMSLFFIAISQQLKWYYDENRIFPIEAILKHKQVVYMRTKMPFTFFKYLLSFQRYLRF